jgi:hypothetical protein
MTERFARQNVFGCCQELFYGGAQPFQQHWLLIVPNSLSRSKFCMFRAPTWRTSAYSANSPTLSGLITSVTTGRPVSFEAAARSFNPLPQPLKGVRTRSRLEHAAAQHVCPADLTTSGLEDLILVLDGTGTGDDDRTPPLPISTPETLTTVPWDENPWIRACMVGDMDHLLYTRQIPNARIIHITLVAEHTDGGPLAAGYRSRRVPQFSTAFITASICFFPALCALQ